MLPSSTVSEQHIDATAICVLGMHRGGTSAIASAIHTLGAYFGPEAHLMKVRADNPAGFFEHQLLTDLNDEILWALNGSWHEPPPLEEGWEVDSRLDELRERARRLLHEDFGAAPLWCWKDPRTSLTLSFWRPLLPRPRYVLCLRNPIDVARSLQARDGFSMEKGIDLWMCHMTRAVRDTGDAPVLLVAYDDVVNNPEGELERLAAFIGRPRLEAASSDAQAPIVIDSTLRHHYTTVADALRSADASYASSAFYASLETWLALQRLDSSPDDDSLAIARWLADSSAHAHRNEREGRRLPGVIANQEAALADQNRVITAHTTAIAEQNATIAKQNATIAEQNATIAKQNATMTNQQAALAASEAEARQLHSLIQHLETPLGALKVGVRGLLPTPVREKLRAWIRRILPGVLRG